MRIARVSPAGSRQRCPIGNLRQETTVWESDAKKTNLAVQIISRNARERLFFVTVPAPDLTYRYSFEDAFGRRTGFIERAASTGGSIDHCRACSTHKKIECFGSDPGSCNCLGPLASHVGQSVPGRCVLKRLGVAITATMTSKLVRSG